MPPRLQLTGLVAALAVSMLAAAAPSGVAGSRFDDPLEDLQWHLDVIGAREAWNTSTGSGAVIAVIDTGVDLDHPDLKGNLAGRGLDGMDANDRDGAQDEEGHGTHVAGIAAAVGGNGIGVAGVAPEASILPIRHGNFVEDPEQFEAEVRYAVRQGADVINMSLADIPVFSNRQDPDGRYREVVARALRYAWRKGVVLVAAANNLASPTCSWPAAAPRVLCVGATNRLDQLATYSNYEAMAPKEYLVAPGGEASVTYGVVSAAGCGEQILSTAMHLELFPVVAPARSACSPAEGYDEMSGTSMAAPVVSGVAALLASMGLDNEQIVDTILSTAKDLGVPGRDPRFGYGRVDAAAAVAEAEHVLGSDATRSTGASRIVHLPPAEPAELHPCNPRSRTRTDSR